MVLGQTVKANCSMVLYTATMCMHSPQGDETDNCVSPHGPGVMCTVSRACLREDYKLVPPFTVYTDDVFALLS